MTATAESLDLVTQIRYAHDWCELSLSGHDEPVMVRRTWAMALGSDGMIHIGLATCGPLDNFCRATGRMKAEHRLRGQAKKGYFCVASLDDIAKQIPESFEVEQVESAPGQYFFDTDNGFPAGWAVADYLLGRLQEDQAQ